MLRTFNDPVSRKNNPDHHFALLQISALIFSEATIMKYRKSESLHRHFIDFMGQGTGKVIVLPELLRCQFQALWKISAVIEPDLELLPSKSSKLELTHAQALGK